jgi:short-subunit dehydrogenase
VTDFVERYGPWALVTGASSGIGAEFARQLAGRGLHLVLVARRDDRLEASGAELQSQHGVEVRTVGLDLREPGFLDLLEPAVAGLEIGLLVNNAGAALSGPLLEQDLDPQVALIHLNCRAPLVLTHRFGRPMAERGRGGIIFLSSTVAMNGGPMMAAYAATKAWNLTLADALTTELAPAGVHVQALVPGMTRTEGLEGSMDLDRLLFRPMDVTPVVEQSLEGLGRRAVVVPGPLNKATTFATRFLLPRRLRHGLMGAVRPFKGKS